MPIKEPPPLLLTAEEPDDQNNNRNKRIVDELIKNALGSSLVSNDEPMTVEQATSFLGYRDVHVVLNLINSGALKAHKVGKRWLIWKSDLIAYINGV